MSNAESPKVYKVPAANLSTLESKFRQLGRRAKRIGLPAPTFTEVGVERLERKRDNGELYVTLLHHIVVDSGCTEVKVQGWTFIATIQHTEEGNIIRKVGESTEVPVKYRNVTNLCEHCNTNRFRKDTYILVHEDGSTKQVGRNCLSDFFGHDALMYAERAQYLSDIDALGESMEDDLGFGGGGGGPKYERLEEFLAYVAECIRLDGWLSRGKARQLSMEGQATCEVAYRHLHPRSAGSDFKPMFRTPSEESVNVANSALEWASEIEGEDIADYLHNIRTIARRMVCEGRDMGLAASIVAAYQRHLAQLRYKELQARRAEIAQHVGEVGAKVRVKVTIEKVVQLESMYGTSHLHIMSDNDGNVFVWFSSAGAYETGKEIILQGTIKKHDERNGVKQNVLTRCSEIEIKNYYANVNGQVHKCEAASESEVKKMLRERLGLKKLPAGTHIIESVSEDGAQ